MQLSKNGGRRRLAFLYSRKEASEIVSIWMGR
jgi:hypothetical protein